MRVPVSSAAGSVWGVHDFVSDYRGEVFGGNFVRVPGRSGPSGCGWYRVIVPLAELGRHGWDTAWRAGVPPREADGYRVITAQRLDKPEALPIWRRLRARHRLVYETDDDIFSVPGERWVHATYPQHIMQESVTAAAQCADLVTVSTEPLAEVYRRLGCQDVRVLPNCLPDGVIGLKRQRNRRKLIVGWAGGGSHAKDLAMIADGLRHFLDRHPGAELHLIGANFTDLFGRRCRYTDWIPCGPDLDYYRAMDFDIALCPLTGTKFDQSKSGIKALEAMAAGIPVLASDVEPYRGTVIDGVNGYLIRRKADWARRLHELAGDPVAREEMGANGLQMAREHTIGANWQRWADVYKELL